MKIKILLIILVQFINGCALSTSWVTRMGEDLSCGRIGDFSGLLIGLPAVLMMDAASFGTATPPEKHYECRNGEWVRIEDEA
jgi:hypothetical protein